MEFVSLACGAFSKGSYTANREICDRVVKEMHDYCDRYGKRPETLILGWGTYLTLCITVSEFRGHTKVGQVIKLTEFEGCKIVIDPSYEFLVASIGGDDTWETAIHAFFESKKINRAAHE